MLKAMVSGLRGPKDRTPMMESFSIFDMVTRMMKSTEQRSNHRLQHRVLADSPKIDTEWWVVISV